MRTIKTTVYSIDELNEDAKKKAIDEIRYSEHYNYFWGDDSIESLKAFAKHFGSKVVNYSIDWGNAYGPSWVEFEPITMDPDELAHAVGELKTDGSCQFTGYCSDDDCNDGAVKAFKEMDEDLRQSEDTVVYVLKAGYDSWIKACWKDYEYQMSKEYVIEHCEANDYEFLEDGSFSTL